MNTFERTGLWAGIAAPLLYVLTVVGGGLVVPGYSQLADPVSALTATGRSGVRWIEAALAFYNLLLLTFAAFGLMRLDRMWRPALILLMVVAALGLLMWPFATDMPGAQISLRGAIHIVLATLASLLTIAIVLLSLFNWQRLGHRNMRLFCALSLTLILSSGIAAAIATPQGWPTAGLFERITIGAFQVWLLVNTAMLIRGGASLASSTPAQ